MEQLSIQGHGEERGSEGGIGERERQMRYGERREGPRGEERAETVLIIILYLTPPVNRL